MGSTCNQLENIPLARDGTSSKNEGLVTCCVEGLVTCYIDLDLLGRAFALFHAPKLTEVYHNTSTSTLRKSVKVSRHLFDLGLLPITDYSQVDTLNLPYKFVKFRGRVGLLRKHIDLGLLCRASVLRKVDADQGRGFTSSTLNPQPSTLHPQPSTEPESIDPISSIFLIRCRVNGHMQDSQEQKLVLNFRQNHLIERLR